MRRRTERAGIWRRTPMEAVAVAPVPIGVWTVIAVAEAVVLFGTVITMVWFPGSPSSPMAIRGFLVLSLIVLVLGAAIVVALSRRPRYSRHRHG